MVQCMPLLGLLTFMFLFCPHRTETVVEKLLTNWMSICLYAFLRVCVFEKLIQTQPLILIHVQKVHYKYASLSHS